MRQLIAAGDKITGRRPKVVLPPGSEISYGIEPGRGPQPQYSQRPSLVRAESSGVRHQGIRSALGLGRSCAPMRRMQTPDGVKPCLCHDGMAKIAVD